MDWTFPLAWAAAVVAAVTLVSFAGTGMMLRILKSRAILDHPSERSSHSQPTPKGGGIAVVLVVAAAWVGLGWGSPAAGTVFIIAATAVGLGALSWVDDLKGLNPLLRLLGQAAAVVIVFTLAPGGGPYFGGLLPGFLDLMAAGLLWLWFINLFNFMDGIDGIAGVETASLGLGVALVAAAAGLSPLFLTFGLVLVGAALGFLWWNWHPARIFLGDVGSVPLGFLLGWLLLGLAAKGQWAAALILPLYYLADTSLTLAKRCLKGEKIWQAHRQHFYQLAVKRGLSHAQVAGHVLGINVVLVVLAVMAAGGLTGVAVAGALTSVAWLLFILAGGRRAGDAGMP